MMSEITPGQLPQGTIRGSGINMPRVSNIDGQLNPSVLQKMSDLSRMPEALKGNSLISYENTKDNSYIEGTSHNNSYIQNNFNLNLTGLP